MNMSYDFDITKTTILSEIQPLLDKHANLYLVGGCMRDIYLNKESFDMDFIVQNQNAIELAKNFAQKTNRYFILLDEEHEIARVVDQDKTHYFDFARCENDNIENDLARRDLTINAIAMQLYPQMKLLDNYNGIKDLQNNTIKAISEKNLTDDPLRILRIFRFASTLNFQIEKETLAWAKKHFKLIKNVAPERILTELLKLFEGTHSAYYINIMKEIGLLYELFDLLAKEEKIPPNTHHHLKLIDHSIETVNQVENLLPNMPQFVIERLDSFQVPNVKYISLMKLAALLHDVGKPNTWTIEENGRHRFINHDSVGAELLKKDLKEMKFSKAQIKYITTLVKYHIYPSQLARENETCADKTILRMFRKLNEHTPDIILLAMADRLSAQGPAITKEITENNLTTLKQYLSKYEEFAKTATVLPKLLDGNEIAQILNIKKDKNLGEIIKKLSEAQSIGEVKTKQDAIEFIKLLNK